MGVQLSKVPGVTAFRVTTTVAGGLAIIVTSSRLWVRRRGGKLWWDDAWAALSMMMDFVFIVTTWIMTADGIGPFPQPLHTRAIAYWMSTLAFTCCIWTARLSIMVTIVRVANASAYLQKTTKILVASLIIMWLTLVIKKIIRCSSDSLWESVDIPGGCPLGTKVAITELTLDLVSDSVLVVMPLILLWNVKFPVRRRRMVLTVFSMSVCTSITSLAHVLFVVKDAIAFEGITAALEASVSLIVCNLLVIVTFVYRIIFRKDAIESLTSVTSDSDTESAAPAFSLTTIDEEHATPATLTRISLGESSFNDPEMDNETKDAEEIARASFFQKMVKPTEVDNLHGS